MGFFAAERVSKPFAGLEQLNAILVRRSIILMEALGTCVAVIQSYK
jgi:hypothetical protein